jgi:Raf kinase inhibitor-like YbhB/YbcL family protein
MTDPDGRAGLGVQHLVAYNIPATVSALAAGDAERQPVAFTLGDNTAGSAAYRGPCPPLGDSPHHYVIEVYALDLNPSLAPGLDRSGLLTAIASHVLRNASIVGTYAGLP